MSSNTLTFTCIGTDTPALTHLHQLLQACIGVKSEQWPKLLQECFEDWESPYVMSASLRGQTLRFVVDSSAGDELEKSHILALHAAGAEYIRLRTWYGQVGETRTLYLHGGKRVSAKSFPAPTLSEEERLYELVLEGKDAALAKEVKAGAPPDAVVDGKPLFVHVARADMGKSMEALFDAKADLGRCLPWAPEVVRAVAYRDSKKTEPMLRALLGAPKQGTNAPAGAPVADAAALWNATVLRGLGQVPALLAWLVAQEGVDVNAMLLFAQEDAQPLQEIGSLLFNSVEFFKDDPGVLAALAARGARSVAPPGMSDARRIQRMYWGYRDAETIPQLAAAGVNLDTPPMDGDSRSLLRLLLRTPCIGNRDLTLATALLDAGATARCWMDPVDFQAGVLAPVFCARDRVMLGPIVAPGEDERFDIERDGRLIVHLLRGLLAQGLDANVQVSLCLMALGRDYGQDVRYPRLRYRGPLLGAIACLLCGPGSDMRSLCLPLVTLLLQHGASPHAEAVVVADLPRDEHFSDLYIHGDWPRNTRDFAPTGSVLERVRQRHAAHADDTDAAVLKALEQPRG